MCVQRTTLIMSKKNLIERDRERLTVQENAHNILLSKKKYLNLSKAHHPDVLVSKGVPKEVIEESKKKMRAINSAFDQIEKMKS